MNRITDRCKNITFSQLRLRTVNMYAMSFLVSEATLKCFLGLSDITALKFVGCLCIPLVLNEFSCVY